jgi:hypothetical protein
MQVLLGAGDGNRTRTVSLGSGTVTADVDPDLAVLAAAWTDRGEPLITLANGTIMARRP